MYKCKLPDGRLIDIVKQVRTPDAKAKAAEFARETGAVETVETNSDWKRFTVIGTDGTAVVFT